MRGVIWCVIFVVLMMFWLLGGGYYVYNSASPNMVAFGAGTLIPWACVAILGGILFGGISAGTGPPRA